MTQMILKGIPYSLIDGLDPEDQAAIRGAIGKPVTLVDIRDDGKAEVEFMGPGNCGPDGCIHTIWVETTWLEPCGDG